MDLRNPASPILDASEVDKQSRQDCKVALLSRLARLAALTPQERDAACFTIDDQIFMTAKALAALGGQ